jgi:hypothetical protein
LPAAERKRPSGPITGERLRGLNKRSKKPKQKRKNKQSFIQLCTFFPISDVDQSLAAMLRSLALQARRLPNDFKKLKSKIYVLNKKILRLNMAVQRKPSKKPSRSDQKKISLSYLSEILKPAQYEFVASLINNSDKEPNGRRYSDKFKTICLGLYIFDPRAYNNLRNLLVCFPSESTLKVIINIIPSEFSVDFSFNRK